MFSTTVAAAAVTAEHLSVSPHRIHLLLAESLFAAEQWAEDTALFLRFLGDEVPTTVIPFPEPGPVRKIEVHILDRSKGARHPGRAGFAEIGLRP